MSLTITPYPTASGMQRAMSLSTGVSIDAKYIGVGKGLQAIKLDDAGRAITDTMKDPVVWVEILNSEKVTPYQHQMVVDFAGVADREFKLSEIVLADENKQAIAIYGNPDQALITVSPQIDHAFVAINLVLAAFPADSINIIHQDIPLELLNAPEMVAIHNAIGEMSYGNMLAANERIALKKTVKDQAQQAVNSASLISQLQQQLFQLQQLVVAHHQEQQQFNASVHNGFGSLSLAHFR